MFNMFRSKIFLKHFFSIFLIVCITFAAVSFTILVIIKLSLQNQQLHTAESYRKELSNTLRRWTKGRECNIKTQALFLGRLEEESLSSDEFNKIINEQLNWDKDFLDIVIVDDKGKVINSREGSNQNANLSDRIYFQNAIKGMPTVTGFISGIKTKNLFMVVAEPVFIEGTPKYVLLGIIAIDSVKEIIESAKLGEIGHIYLVDEDGMFITGSSSIKEYVGGIPEEEKNKYKLNTFAVERMLLKEHGTSMYKDFEAEQVIGSYEWLDALKVGLVVEFKSSKALGPLNDLLKAITLLTVVVMAGGLLTAYLLSRRIIIKQI